MNIRYIELKNHSGGLTRLNIVVDGDKTILAELVGKIQADPSQYELELKKIRHKRGLTANAYYWALVEKLAKAMGSSKDEIHKELIIRYGSMKLDENDDPIVFSVLAGSTPDGINPYVRPFAEGYVNGKRFIHYYVLKGSSECNNAEFACLLDGCISECEGVGISTLTRSEISKLEYLNPHSASDEKEQ